jgi:hypothetical protein
MSINQSAAALADYINPRDDPISRRSKKTGGTDKLFRRFFYA